MLRLKHAREPQVESCPGSAAGNRAGAPGGDDPYIFPIVVYDKIQGHMEIYQAPILGGNEDFMDNELLATAYHEAGHAVIAYLHGRRFKRVSIEPNEDCNGFIEYYDARIIGEILSGTHCSIWLIEHSDEQERIVKRCILSAMAGYISQDIGVPGSVEPYQWEADRELLGEILVSWDSEQGWDKAEMIVRRELKDNWCLVEYLAQWLIEKRSLNGREIRSALDSEPLLDAARIGRELSLSFATD